MINSQTRSALKTLDMLRDSYKRVIFKRGKGMTKADLEGYSRRVWALNVFEDILFETDDPPLVALGKFGYKMSVYRCIDSDFEDCVIACNQLDAYLVK